MARKERDVAAQIREKHLCSHCAAHRLNLCAVKCCGIQEVNNVMQRADLVSRFFNNSFKQQVALDIECHWGKHANWEKEKTMQNTLSGARHASFETFLDLYKPLTTELIASGRTDECNRETQADGHSFLLSYLSFFLYSCSCAYSEITLLHQRSKYQTSRPISCWCCQCTLWYWVT